MIEKAVILSVDMLLEGVHLPDVTGIVLFRNVTSLVTFQQILGRVCSMSNKTEPVIADASSSGPEMLAKLYRMDGENKSRENGDGSGRTKPIFTLGIGADREWKGIEEFLRLYTSMGSEMDRKEKLEKAVKKYLQNRTGYGILLGLVPWARHIKAVRCRSAYAVRTSHVKEGSSWISSKLSPRTT